MLVLLLVAYLEAVPHYIHICRPRPKCIFSDNMKESRAPGVLGCVLPLKTPFATLVTLRPTLFLRHMRRHQRQMMRGETILSKYLHPVHSFFVIEDDTSERNRVITNL